MSDLVKHPPAEPDDVTITALPDHIEVTGVSEHDLREALILLRTLRGEHSATLDALTARLTSTLTDALTSISRGVGGPDASESLIAFKAELDSLTAQMRASVATVPTVNVRALVPGYVAAAQGVAAHRVDLLAMPTYTISALSQVRRDTTESATHAWVRRAHDAGRIFLVKESGHPVLPAFQFTDDGDVRGEIEAVTKILRDGAEPLTGWETWTWWTSRTGYLSGQVPVDVVADNPARVESAARAFMVSTAA